MKLTLPDGKILEVAEKIKGNEVARQIAISLEKKSLAFSLDHQLYDLRDTVPHDGDFSLITANSQEAFSLLNHSTSHLLAAAINNLFPKALFGFGPDIEEGFYYDIDFGDTLINEEDFPKIEAEMLRLAKENSPFVKEVVSKEIALEIFKDNPYKVELIQEITGEISIYRNGTFVDLCHGPHLPSTGIITHFKLLSLAGAYWRGDSNNKQLVRIYGTSFFTSEALKAHLENLEERKKRDHRKLGRDLGLFMVSEFGPGFPFWLPNGLVLRNKLEDFWYDIHKKNGYQFIKTPIILSKELWETSGHWANYRENMYITNIDEHPFVIKPMNCPGGLLVYKNELRSYKDLPLRLGELGLVHRHEASGALAGLFRVRTFTQDDAHIFIREDQIIDEIARMLKLFDEVYTIFNLDYHIELSTRPEKKFIGDLAIWEKSEKALAEACQKSGKVFKINPGDGAFYGPKLDFKLRDSMGRIWQCGTIQLDMNLPERFDISYIDHNNEKVRPIMLHRALFGSLERFIGIITEHFYGAFPTWLAPIQVNLLPVVNDLHLEYANQIKELLELENINVKIDSRVEKIGYRMRDSQVNKIPYTIVIGDQEVANKTLTYRIYGKQEQITISILEFLDLIKEEIHHKKLRK